MSEPSIVKHCRITVPRMPKGWHRKSTGICKCGATRTNAKDAYCRDCRRLASAAARQKAKAELEALRALAARAKHQDEGKSP